MVSEKEIEAAREAWREYWSDVIGQYDDNKGPMEGMRRALEAAARVRAEANNGCGEAVIPAPQPSGPVEDLLDEGLEILNALIDNIKRRGNYSPDATCTFIDQAGQCLREALSALTAGKPEQHPDDEAVDRFAAAMKAKLKWEREERGRYGWNDPSICPESYLARLLIEHLAKGNDGNFEDVANFCMMLHQRGAHPRVLADALTAGKSEQEATSGLHKALAEIDRHIDAAKRMANDPYYKGSFPAGIVIQDLQELRDAVAASILSYDEAQQ